MSKTTTLEEGSQNSQGHEYYDETEFHKSETILVTGASGYIGTNFCNYLLEHESATDDTVPQLHIHGIDIKNHKIADGYTLTTDNKKDPPFRFFLANICDNNLARIKRFAYRQSVRTVVEYDCVYHFAGLKSVPESVIKPLDYYTTNVGGTVNLLKMMQMNGSRLLVFSSTCAVYGDAKSNLVETDQCNPVNPYGHSKLMAEQAIKDQCATGKLRAVCLRYFNVYGGDYIDEISPNLHSTISRAKKTGSKIEVFGTDYPTRDGTAIRDYVHMSDLIEAHLLAKKYLEDHPNVQFEVFNIGSERGKTVLEIINEIGVGYIPKPSRVGDPAELIGNCEKAKQLLGWQVKK